MKDIKLSFPYPSTSRHNLSQDVALSLSMGIVIPVRTIEVLPGDSHRIATSFSLVSNPLVKPLLQGVRMRYCRFWVPRRIYHYQLRANNADYDPQTASVRYLGLTGIRYPLSGAKGSYVANGQFQQSSLFDYLGYANVVNSFGSSIPIETIESPGPLLSDDNGIFWLNAEPYLCYIDICRNFFSDTAANMIGWTGIAYKSGQSPSSTPYFRTIVSPLAGLDSYIDSVQNESDQLAINPFQFGVGGVVLSRGTLGENLVPNSGPNSFSPSYFGVSHYGFCVPLNRPDRVSRLFSTKPLVSQNALVSSNEISIANLSFLSKLQRYLTRKFFGGTRYTDVMYSIFGQRVPHVDSPILLDVFDQEIGSELVASTNATESSNPGVLGGYFSSSGVLTTSSGSSRRRYTFNEAGYIMDVVYIMPRLFRSAFISDILPVEHSSTSNVMSQGNFVPDMNGIGWQQPAYGKYFRPILFSGGNPESVGLGSPISVGCEPSWQQYRTLPDVCLGAMNPLRSTPLSGAYSPLPSSIEINSPLFVFTDRMSAFPMFDYSTTDASASTRMLAHLLYTDPADFNRVFGTSNWTFDNIFAVFRYSHQSKRQVTKRFTLTFA